MHPIEQRLDSYLLARDLAPETERWYRRVVLAFAGWLRHDNGPLDHEAVSRFLWGKQRAGRSPYYCRSLRNGLLAVLGEVIDGRKVRRLRMPGLSPASWSRSEVARIIAAASVLPAYKQTFYRQIVAVAYHTGLSKVDIDRLTRADFNDGGVLITRRHRTGKLVVAWVPRPLLAKLPAVGLLFPRRWSDEQFRRDFRRMVAAAGLAGTFKQLRKTSGTEAELLTGRGHEHLANSRRVFEAHYLDARKVHRKPVRLRLPRIA